MPRKIEWPEYEKLKEENPNDVGLYTRAIDALAAEIEHSIRVLGKDVVIELLRNTAKNINKKNLTNKVGRPKGSKGIKKYFEDLVLIAIIQKFGKIDDLPENWSRQIVDMIKGNEERFYERKDDKSYLRHDHDKSLMTMIERIPRRFIKQKNDYQLELSKIKKHHKLNDIESIEKEFWRIRRYEYLTGTKCT